MGYMPGQGLGKTSQGRVEPVEIIILPTGKSLDVCAELREAKKVRKVDGVEVLKKKRRKKKKEFKGSTPAEEGVHDMFDFINTKVFAKNVPKRKNVQLEKSDSANTSNLNLKLFKVQENMKAINKQKESLKESLQRHQKRKDKQLESKVKEKLAAIESQLEHLHRQEQSIEKNITTKSERKKLSIF